MLNCVDRTARADQAKRLCGGVTGHGAVLREKLQGIVDGWETRKINSGRAQLRAHRDCAGKVRPAQATPCLWRGAPGVERASRHRRNRAIRVSPGSAEAPAKFLRAELWLKAVTVSRVRLPVRPMIFRPGCGDSCVSSIRCLPISCLPTVLELMKRLLQQYEINARSIRFSFCCSGCRAARNIVLQDPSSGTH